MWQNRIGGLRFLGTLTNVIKSLRYKGEWGGRRLGMAVGFTMLEVTM
jgi:hypothetical protein